MAYQVSLEEVTEMFYEDYFCQNKQIAIPPTTVLLPKRLGIGGFNVVRAGRHVISAMNIIDANDVDISSSSHEDTYFISLGINGSVQYDHIEHQSQMNMQQNTAYLGFTKKNDKSLGRIKNQNLLRFITIFISKSDLLEYAIEFDNPMLVKAILNAQQSCIFSQTSLNQRQTKSVTSLFNSPFHGAMHRLHMEYTCSELLYTLVSHLCSTNPHQSSSAQVDPLHVKLSERDKIQLHKAKQILLSDMSNPPTIAELAKQIAINEDKLKKGFKLLFNNTIFKTLTEHRMQMALVQLKKNDMSIAEIAHHAGYDNVSSFIAVFKKTYQVTPGKMRKEVSFFI